jgi:acetyl esterase
MKLLLPSAIRWWLGCTMAWMSLGGEVVLGQEADPRPGQVFVYKTSSGQTQDIEIYFPPNHDRRQSKVPGLILFHGGGWGGGDLSQFRRACEYFASRGLVSATANYRMLATDEARRLPADRSRKRVCVTDAKSAIRWFKQHAAELGIDPHRIITGGGSAGGHISVLATTNPGLNDPADAQGVDTDVLAYLLFNPAFSDVDQRDAAIDVHQYLTADLPPAIVFFGTDDSWKKGWDTVHQRLIALGNTTTQVRLANGQKHSFFNKDPWQTVTLIEADRFLMKLGLLRGEPTLTPPSSGEQLVP